MEQYISWAFFIILNLGPCWCDLAARPIYCRALVYVITKYMPEPGGKTNKPKCFQLHNPILDKSYVWTRTTAQVTLIQMLQVCYEGNR
jgi:hypothetical protein